MIKEGDKYIITIDAIYKDVENKKPILYRGNGMKTLVFDSDGLDKLEKYNPDEEYQKGRQVSKAEREQIFNHGMDKAWEMAKEIRFMPTETREELFNGEYYYPSIMHKYTSQEVKEILGSRNLEDVRKEICSLMSEECPYSIECSECEVYQSIEKAKSKSREKF